MPQEGNVQVSTFFATVATGQVVSQVVEMGAKGQAVELLGIHTSFFQMRANSIARISTALSTNPEHLLAPPTSVVEMLRAKSLYGLSITGHETALVVEGGNDQSWTSIIIPLYGIIRPRRQILILGQSGGVAGNEFKVEVYYRPSELSKVELDALNLKYGKYRRGA